MIVQNVRCYYPKYKYLYDETVGLYCSNAIMRIVQLSNYSRLRYTGLIVKMRIAGRSQ